MNKSPGRLRLGALPKIETVKVTVALPANLKSRLDRYAALHSQEHGETVDAVALIPHMLAAFVERDRAFKALCQSSGTRANSKARSTGDSST